MSRFANKFKESLSFKIAVIVGGLVLVLLLLMVSPIFYVQEVVIQGNMRVNDNNIRANLDIGPTTNILMLNTSTARRRVMQNLYIDGVSFRRDLPNRLYVTVFERRPSAYIEHLGSFLYLDEMGRVLEVRPYMDDPLPLLEGLRFSRFQLGEILETYNQADFASVVHYTQLLVNHGLIDRISHINVTDPGNMRILVDYVEFNVGDVSYADRKVRTILAVLEQTPGIELMRGFVDIREIRAEFSLELLQ